MQTLEYYVLRQYGTDRYYIVDTKVENILQDLLGTKTITPKHMRCLTLLGFEFKQVLPATI